MDEIEPKEINMRTRNMLAAYADGVSVVDIAAKNGLATPGAVYNIFYDYPDEHAEAKKARAEHSIAKYRRAGNLSINLQLQYLERLSEMNPDDPVTQELIAKEITKIQSIGETAERRADLNEGKPTERMDNMSTQIVVFKQTANVPEIPE